MNVARPRSSRPREARRLHGRGHRRPGLLLRSSVRVRQEHVPAYGVQGSDELGALRQDRRSWVRRARSRRPPTRSGWLVGLDADPQPTATHVLDPKTLDTDYPQGVALVQTYSFDDRDTSSFNALRNYLFPVDSLLQDPNSAQVVTYDDTIDQRRVRGVHIVFQFRRARSRRAQADAQAAATNGTASDLQRTLLGGTAASLLSPDYVTVSQTALVSVDTNRVYYIAVLCSAACYDRNKADIESTVSSWTVLP